MLAFLQLHSPDFMILQKDLKAIPKPPRDRLPRAQFTVIPIAPTSANNAPVLSSIDPIVHPVAGGRMTVTGVNFKPGITATFVGPTASRNGDVQFLSSSKIVVWGPPLPSAVRNTEDLYWTRDVAQIYSLVVTNDDGLNAELPDIIIYSDEPFRSALAPTPTVAPEPEWASEMKAKVYLLSVSEIDLRGVGARAIGGGRAEAEATRSGGSREEAACGGSTASAKATRRAVS